MEALLGKHDALSLRKIDIGRWGSPVAEQYGIRSIPALHLYDGKKLVSKDSKVTLGRRKLEV